MLFAVEDEETSRSIAVARRIDGTAIDAEVAFTATADGITVGNLDDNDYHEMSHVFQNMRNDRNNPEMFTVGVISGDYEIGEMTFRLIDNNPALPPLRDGL